MTGFQSPRQSGRVQSRPVSVVSEMVARKNQNGDGMPMLQRAAMGEEVRREARRGTFMDDDAIELGKCAAN